MPSHPKGAGKGSLPLEKSKKNNSGAFSAPSAFQAKACPGLDPGWKPVRVKKTRQIRNLEPRFDSIETETALVGVAGGEVPRDLRAFLNVPADCDRGRRRAGPVGLLEAVIAAVEARDHAGAAVARGGFGIDQRLHFVAPFGPFIGAANAPQIVQGAEDLGQPLQVAVERRGRILGPRRTGMACRDDNESGQKVLEHDLFFGASSNG